MAEYDLEADAGDNVHLFCDPSALDGVQRKRRLLLAQLLQVGTVDVVELPDGYALQVDPMSIIAQHLEEFAALEGLCCPFLTIGVRTATAGGQPVLEIGGGDLVKEFIAAQFGIRKRPTP